MAGPVPEPGQMAVGPQQNVAAPAGATILTPSSDVANAVATHPPGTTFFLQPGTYRTQKITPLLNDTFIGAYGAILNGSRLLTTLSHANGRYAATNQAAAPDAEVIGVCTSAYPRCNYPQDLYFDGKPLRAVASLSALTPGTWYFDYPNTTVYFVDNPQGHVVELSYSTYAFGGSAANVTIKNLVVEKYASADQRGAVGNNAGGTNWNIINNEVRLNHGVGISLGTGNHAIANFVHDNGELGMGGTGSGIMLTSNEIAFNVWNGTDCDWECGGAKFGAATNLTIQGNYVHDNQGDGLWDDVGCRNVAYASNLIARNLNAGISHEIGYAAVIHHNVLIGNGATTYDWGWQAQVQVQNSSNTQIYSNQVTMDSSRGGNGITIIQQNRGSQYMVHDVQVYDNTVTMPGGDGVLVGWFADYNPNAYLSGNNLFYSNHYHAFTLANDFWMPNSWGYSFPMWQGLGQDVAGTADTIIPSGS